MGEEGGQGVSHCSVMVGEGGWETAGEEASDGGGGHQCHNLRRNWWHTLTFLGLYTPEVTGCEGSSEVTDKETVGQKNLKTDICAPFACVHTERHTTAYSMPYNSIQHAIQLHTACHSF